MLFTSNAVDTGKFKPNFKVEVEGAENLVLSLFPSGLKLFFYFSILTVRQKKSEKLKKSHFGHIQVQFVFCLVS